MPVRAYITCIWYPLTTYSLLNVADNVKIRNYASSGDLESFGRAVFKPATHGPTWQADISASLSRDSSHAVRWIGRTNISRNSHSLPRRWENFSEGNVGIGLTMKLHDSCLLTWGYIVISRVCMSFLYCIWSQFIFWCTYAQHVVRFITVVCSQNLRMSLSRLDVCHSCSW